MGGKCSWVKNNRGLGEKIFRKNIMEKSYRGSKSDKPKFWTICRKAPITFFYDVFSKNFFPQTHIIFYPGAFSAHPLGFCL
jgi:hypothetical protein